MYKYIVIHLAMHALLIAPMNIAKPFGSNMQ